MTKCLWCNRAFTPRTNGGHPQRFCGPPCRRAYDAAGRRWVAEALAVGTLTIPDLKDGSAATRALVGAGKIQSETPLPVPEPPDPVLGAISAAADAPAPVAPAERPGEAAEMLADLVGVLFGLRGDAWSAVATAIPGELQRRIDRYLGLS